MFGRQRGDGRLHQMGEAWVQLEQGTVDGDTAVVAVDASQQHRYTCSGGGGGGEVSIGYQLLVSQNYIDICLAFGISDRRAIGTEKSVFFSNLGRFLVGLVFGVFDHRFGFGLINS